MLQELGRINRTMDPMVGWEEGPRAGSQGGAGEGWGPLALGWERGGGNLPAVWSPALWGRAVPDGRFLIKRYPGPVLPGEPGEFLLPGPPSSSPPEETAHAGPGREPSKPPLARPGAGVPSLGPWAGGRVEGLIALGLAPPSLGIFSSDLHR